MAFSDSGQTECLHSSGNERETESQSPHATAGRRYKSEHNLALGSDLAHLHISTPDGALASLLAAGTTDLQSITRAQTVTFTPSLNGTAVEIPITPSLSIAIMPG